MATVLAEEHDGLGGARMAKGRLPVWLVCIGRAQAGFVTGVRAEARRGSLNARGDSRALMEARGGRKTASRSKNTWAPGRAVRPRDQWSEVDLLELATRGGRASERTSGSLALIE